MSPQKTKARRNASQAHSSHQHHHSLSNTHFPVQQPTTDYDTDNFYPSDTGAQVSHHQQIPYLPHSHNGAPRTTADLNLAVLRSYNPSIASIVSIAPYAVLYVWNSERGTWEKCNMEGTLFICALDHSDELPGHQRFVAIILNRRALGVFATLLEKTEDIEVSDEFVIIRVKGDLGGAEQDGEEPDAEGKIYGLWIFSEAGSSTANTREQIAAVIKECASMAESTRSAAEDAMKLQEASREHMGHSQHAHHQSGAMGRQLSLTELFSRQREADAGFAVHDHHSPGVPQAISTIPEMQVQAQQAAVSSGAKVPAAPNFQNSADTDFFRGASPYQTSLQQKNGSSPGIGAVVGAGQNALLDLFKKA